MFLLNEKCHLHFEIKCCHSHKTQIVAHALQRKYFKYHSHIYEQNQSPWKNACHHLQFADDQ